jgi:phosphohistidine phosphatase
VDLILWRHAEAEDGYPDEKRKLTAKGHKQAAKMAAWLDAHLPKHFALLVSPAVRTQQTASALRSKFVTSAEVGLGANPGSLLKAAGWPHASQTVVVVGHQPTLGMSVAKLLTGRDADFNVRRGAIVWVAHKNQRNVLRAVLSPDLV